MKKIKQKFKKGAASFYIVAFSTLILLIIATSFAAIIISELTRSSNDDLAQSAYDSALAGVEDAKLAIYDYQNCKATEDPSTLVTTSGKTCVDIVTTIEELGNDDSTDAETVGKKCNMTAEILGRNTNDDTGVLIQETDYASTQGASNNMQQAYTCVQIQNILRDYTATLSPSAQMDVVEVKLAKDGENGDKSIADKIGKVKISWYDDQNEPDKSNYNYGNFVSNTVAFTKLGGTAAVPAPPTISLAMIQTAQTFSFSDFDMTVGNTTDKGMIYLVPTKGEKKVRAGTRSEEQTFYESRWEDSTKTNKIDATAWTKSNNKEARNLPYAINCPDNGDSSYACSATIDLPHPVNWTSGTNVRNDETFRFVVSLPYGTPSTTFKLEFICTDGSGNETECYSERTDLQGDEQHRAGLENVQIEIDSTGRANDLYRRVQARVKSSSDNSNLSIMGPLELLGRAGVASLEKDYAVTCEYDFDPTCSR